MSNHIDTQITSTAGGTLIAFIGILDWNDLIKTGLLAAIGTVVSFAVSAILKQIFNRKKRNV